VSAGPSQAVSGNANAKKEEKVEAKVEEVVVEDVDLGGGLFGGDEEW